MTEEFKKQYESRKDWSNHDYMAVIVFGYTLLNKKLPKDITYLYTAPFSDLYKNISELKDLIDRLSILAKEYLNMLAD